MKNFIYVTAVIFLIGLIFRMTCGIFVIQPIGAIPEGRTIVYWRLDMPNMPFIGSADGILDKEGQGVSLLGRGVLLGGLAGPLKEKEIFSFGYSETLYLISTGGKQYGK